MIIQQGRKGERTRERRTLCRYVEDSFDPENAAGAEPWFSCWTR